MVNQQINQQGSKIDQEVRVASNPNLTGDQLCDSFTKIATMTYFMAGEVGKLHRAYLTAEAERKRFCARKVIETMADGTSNAKAVAMLEQSAEFWDVKTAEINAEAEYQALKLKMNAADGVLSSIQMRLALMRSEMERTRTS